MDTALKSKPDKITKEDMTESYKKYRSVMGTAGRNMALAKNPLGEIFYSGMAHAAEGVGCGNEMEADSLKHGFDGSTNACLRRVALSLLQRRLFCKCRYSWQNLSNVCILIKKRKTGTYPNACFWRAVADQYFDE